MSDTKWVLIRSAGVQVLLGDQTAKCKQPIRFHQEHPFVEKVTFVLAPESTFANLQIALHDSDQLASGWHHSSWSENQSTCHDQKHEGAHCESLAVALFDSNQNRFGSIDLRVTMLTSAMMSSRNRWKATQQKSLLCELATRLLLRYLVHSWHRNLNRISNESSDAVILLDAPPKRRSRAQVPGQLHPLEEHMGGQHSEKSGVKWTPAHPLALQGYEGLHVMHADVWRVPAPLNLQVEDTAAPPVAKVTAIYGINVITAAPSS